MIVIKHHLNPGVYGASKVHEGGRPASTSTSMSHRQSGGASATICFRDQEESRVPNPTAICRQ